MSITVKKIIFSTNWIFQISHLPCNFLDFQISTHVNSVSVNTEEIVARNTPSGNQMLKMNIEVQP